MDYCFLNFKNTTLGIDIDKFKLDLVDRALGFMLTFLDSIRSDDSENK